MIVFIFYKFDLTNLN